MGLDSEESSGLVIGMRIRVTVAKVKDKITWTTEHDLSGRPGRNNI